MTVWPASFFFEGLPEYVAGYSRPLSIPPTSPREPEWSLFGTPPKPLPQPTSARGPLPQMPQWHPRVARLSGTGVKPVPNRCSGRFSARHPSLQVLQSHPGVAKRSSGRFLAQRPYPQVPQWHPHVARPLSIGILRKQPMPAKGKRAMQNGERIEKDREKG